MDQPVTVIIGLGREVGEAIARRFFEAGHGVVAADDDAERVEHARKQLDDRVQVVRQDALHNAGSLKNCLTIARNQFERLDNLVIVPRLPGPDALETLAPDKFAKAMSQGASQAMLAMRIFAREIEAQEDAAGARADQSRQRGAIVFILSLQHQLMVPGRFTQNASQGAVAAIMRAGALELAPRRIRVNAVAAIRPGGQSEENERLWLKTRTPLGRAALADEIADAALFLSSGQSAFTVGQTLTLDGGRGLLSGVVDGTDLPDVKK
jgi:NAD(P)-dependent dehydrogenase (short-subunit alcohol dehydrogenase family)